MSRLYDENQDFIMDGQYNGDYAMCSVDRHMEAQNGFIKRQPVTYSQISTDRYARPHTQVTSTHSFTAEGKRLTRCVPQFDTVLRACLAEFLAGYASTFLSVYIEDELSMRHISWIQKISLIALTDAMAATLFIAALKTVHLHPAITIAHLFSLTTSWLQCVFVIIIQLIAAITANLTITLMRMDGLPPYVVVNTDINMEWTKAIYKLMFSQFFGTALVVVAHLMSFSTSRRNQIRIGRLTENPCSLFMAISLSSFLSLLQSTSHWNPLQATSISLLRTVSRQGTESLHDQYIFWLGPLIGSLLACFLFRLLCPSIKRRHSCNSGYCEDDSNSI